nr:hypothetical protein [cyanobacterium endosymbiont of Rhopalodia gibberula]
MQIWYRRADVQCWLRRHLSLSEQLLNEDNLTLSQPLSYSFVQFVRPFYRKSYDYVFKFAR